MQIKEVLVVGGDLRQIYLANKLAETVRNGVVYRVHIYGVDKHSHSLINVNLVDENKIDELKSNLDIIVLPMPVLDTRANVNMPLSDKKINVQDILDNINKNCIILGGKIPSELENDLKINNMRYFDYLKREELAVHNAVPTAEGTIQIMMEETAKTIFNSNVLLIGAGRISKILRKYLVSLGANVTVSARKAEDFAWIETDKCKFINIKDIESELQNKDAIINMVPAKILDGKLLSKIDKDTLIIDLASKPGGVDFEMANKLGTKVVWALSLPGKVAPITAGHIILHTIFNILDEMEGNYE